MGWAGQTSQTTPHVEISLVAESSAVFWTMFRLISR